MWSCTLSNRLHCLVQYHFSAYRPFLLFSSPIPPRLLRFPSSCTSCCNHYSILFLIGVFLAKILLFHFVTMLQSHFGRPPPRLCFPAGVSGHGRTVQNIVRRRGEVGALGLDKGQVLYGHMLGKCVPLVERVGKRARGHLTGRVEWGSGPEVCACIKEFKSPLASVASCLNAALGLACSEYSTRARTERSCRPLPSGSIGGPCLIGSTCCLAHS